MTACFAALVCLKGFYQLGAGCFDVVEVGTHITLQRSNPAPDGIEVFQRKIHQLTENRAICRIQPAPEFRLSKLAADEVVDKLRVANLLVFRILRDFFSFSL